MTSRCTRFSFQYFPAGASSAVWPSYAALLLLVFSAIKYFNYQLHAVFDTQESVEERREEAEDAREHEEEGGGEAQGGDRGAQGSAAAVLGRTSRGGEGDGAGGAGIELKELGRGRRRRSTLPEQGDSRESLARSDEEQEGQTISAGQVRERVARREGGGGRRNVERQGSTFGE